MRFDMRPTLAAAVCALTTACSTLVPATAARLAALTPETADPAALSVAIVTPPGLRPVPGTARLILTAARTDTGATETIDAILRDVPGNAAAFDALPGEALTFFALRADDIPAMRALQQRLTEWKAEAPDGTRGSLSVGMAACAVGDGPAPDAVGSVFIRTEPDGSYLPLIARAPLAALIGAETLATIGPCLGPA
jgi:hypothetical protein